MVGIATMMAASKKLDLAKNGIGMGMSLLSAGAKNKELEFQNKMAKQQSKHQQNLLDLDLKLNKQRAEFNVQDLVQQTRDEISNLCREYHSLRLEQSREYSKTMSQNAIALSSMNLQGSAMIQGSSLQGLLNVETEESFRKSVDDANAKHSQAMANSMEKLNKQRTEQLVKITDTERDVNSKKEEIQWQTAKEISNIQDKQTKNIYSTGAELVTKGIDIYGNMTKDTGVKSNKVNEDGTQGFIIPGNK